RAPDVASLPQVEEVVVVREDALVRVEVAEVAGAPEEVADEHHAHRQAEETEGARVDAEPVIADGFQRVHLVDSKKGDACAALGGRPPVSLLRGNGSRARARGMGA